MKRTPEDLRKQFKRGWYKKGKTYRFLHALNEMGFFIYQTKTDFIKKTRVYNGVDPNYDHWFDKAEYIGLELPGETKKSS